MIERSYYVPTEDAFVDIYTRNNVGLVGTWFYINGA